jgi:hypothetical protein
MKSPCLVPLALLGLALSASAQTWTQANPSTSPSARVSVEAVFNPFRQRVVMYGGRTPATLGLQETWTWNGQDWTLQQPTVSPPGKWAHNLAFDWHRNRVVLFGGRQGTTDTNNTWEWNGSNWSEVKTKTLPPARRSFGMAYDMKRRVTVVFGGAGFPSQLGDTWVYDGQDWTQVQTSRAPTPRDHSRMVYDDSRGVIVLFGGWDQKNGNKYLNDTWEFDGQDWTEIKTSTLPQARHWHTMAYDRQRARVLLVGGGFVSDTWEYDGKDWSLQQTAQAPTSQAESAGAFDWLRRKMLHFGGSNRGVTDNETWEYQGVELASYAGWGSGCTGLTGSALLFANAAPQLGKTLPVELANLPSQAGVAVLFLGASQMNWGAIPLPLPLQGLGLGNCQLEITPDVAFAVPATAGKASLPFPIPNSSSLLGLIFYNQALVRDPGANSAGWILSNPARAIIGS